MRQRKLRSAVAANRVIFRIRGYRPWGTSSAERDRIEKHGSRDLAGCSHKAFVKATPFVVPNYRILPACWLGALAFLV